MRTSKTYYKEFYVSPFPAEQATITRPFSRHVWRIGEARAGLWMGAAFRAALGLAIAVLVAMGHMKKA
jgi:hypothetical protein